MSILPQERLERIITLLGNFQHLTTQHIANDLGVSRETVRRDVLKLEKQGHLKRVFGGVSAAGHKTEAPIKARQLINAPEKKRIARHAASIPKPGDLIFIDAGTTVSALASELAKLTGLIIVTNSFDVALKLSENNTSPKNQHEVIVLGGTPKRGLKATYGDITVSQINRYKAKFAFLSPVAFNIEDGASSYDRAEAEIANAMCTNAQRIILLADHSKMNSTSRFQYCKTKDLDTLITDTESKKTSTFKTLKKTINCIAV